MTHFSRSPSALSQPRPHPSTTQQASQISTPPQNNTHSIPNAPCRRRDHPNNPESNMRAAPHLYALCTQKADAHQDSTSAPSPNSNKKRAIYHLILDCIKHNLLNENTQKELQEALEVGSKDDLDFMLETLTELKALLTKQQVERR